MDTSKSNETAAWVAEMFVFSGRRDPVWPISEETARSLEAIWEALEPTAHAAAAPPPLGYRGCQLKDPQGRIWRAFGKVVTLTTRAGTETRSDLGRKFERSLIAAAPAGVLPAPVVALALQDHN
jgi:hypothetical protein